MAVSKRQQNLRQKISTFFRGNKKLRPEGLEIDYTEEQIEELLKCKDDIHYFIENYVYTIHPDHGIISMIARDYQTELIDLVDKNRFIIARWGRQMGKTAIVAAIICHYIIFHGNGKTVAILGNKAANAREVLRRVKIAYENLPVWMQRGVVSWNKSFIELEHEGRIISAATSSDGIRGEAISMLYIDEVAHIPSSVWEDFYDSVYPTVSAGKTTKILMTSTPKGMNHFYEFCMKARRGESTYKEHVARWDRAPERDEQWKNDEILNMGETKFAQEHEVAFVGSSLTLVNPAVLDKLESPQPEHEEEHLTILEPPKEGGIYVGSVDTSRGVSKDYSVCTIFDVSDFPIRDVAMFRCNKTSSVEFPGEIVNLGQLYNDAYMICELNDAGEEVANSLSLDYSYENLLGYDSKSDRSSEKSHELGMWTSKRTKMLGCDRFKTLVNNGYMKPQHPKLITELWHFIENGKGSYEAEDGWNDDTVMTCVNFCFFFFSRSNLHRMFEDESSLKELMDLGAMKRAQDVVSNIGALGGVKSAATKIDQEIMREKELRRRGIYPDDGGKAEKAMMARGYEVGSIEDMSKEERKAFLS